MTPNVECNNQSKIQKLVWWWIDFYHKKTSDELKKRHWRVVFAFTLKPLWTLILFLWKLIISLIHIVYVVPTWPISLILGYRPIPLWHEIWLSLTLHHKELHWRISRYEEYRLWRTETTPQGNQRKIYMPLSFMELICFFTIPPVVIKFILLLIESVGRQGSTLMIASIIVLPIVWLEILAMILKRGGETKIEYADNQK